MIGIASAIESVTSIVDKFIPDPDAKAKLLADIIPAIAESDKAQNKVNEQEAKSESFFKSGWRPAIGWVCALGVAYHFLGHPLIEWVSEVNEWKGDAPDLEWQELSMLVFGLLGMGTLRTVEKYTGTNKRR